MKKIFVFVISMFLSLSGVATSAEINLPEIDKQQIISNMDLFIEAVNKNNSESIVSLISASNTNLQTSILGISKEGISYQFSYNPLDKNIEILSPTSVKISGRFASSGMSWSTSGLSNYFVFEKNLDGQWLISDTNFDEKVGFSNVKKFAKNIFAIIIPIFIVFFIFWLLMLIDCIKRDFDDKALWVVLMIFLGIIGTILYYFMIKKRNITRKPLEFKM